MCVVTFGLFLDRSRTELCVSTVDLILWIARNRRCNVRKAVFTIFFVSIAIAPSSDILSMFSRDKSTILMTTCHLFADYIMRSPLLSTNRVQMATNLIFWCASATNAEIIMRHNQSPENI